VARFVLELVGCLGAVMWGLAQKNQLTKLYLSPTQATHSSRCERERPDSLRSCDGNC